MPNYRLKYTPEAQEDVINAASYYDSQLKGLGKIFKQVVRRQLISIQQYPFSRSVRYDTVRFAVLSKFPYSIHYTVDGENTIVGHAVTCDFRDPMTFWLTRD